MAFRIFSRRKQSTVQERLGRRLHDSFHFRKAIFIHIPKAAGSSVSMALFGHQVGHYTIGEWFERDFAATERYFKFTFVREPLDRLLSAFGYLQAGGMNEADREFSRKHLEGLDFESFVDRLEEDLVMRDWIHFRPQTRFLCNDEFYKKVLVDFVGRFENMAADFARVCEIMGVNVELQHMNKVSRPSKELPVVSPGARAKVHRIYAEDYELFGY